MIVAVASGKGGTGKTTVSASLARVWEDTPMAVDLDVEEPNLHLFLNPAFDFTDSVSMQVPMVDEERCTSCGVCTELCQFKGLAMMGRHVLAFPEMCHGCGGCFLVCPEHALRTGARKLGELCQGTFEAEQGKGAFLMGRLRIGEAMSPPLMREVKDRLSRHLKISATDVILDCPPGVSCPAVNAVMDADVILLVTEPTPFGFHDFALAWEAFAPLDKPLAVVVNRAGTGDHSVQAFCRDKGLPILAEIPDDRAVAEAYSRGQVAAAAIPAMGDIFRTVAAQLKAMSGGGHV